MSGDNWTFLLVRGDDAPVRQYSVSSRAAHYAAGALVAVLVLLTGVGVALGVGGSPVETMLLERENKLLAGELTRLQERVEGLEGTITALSEKDARYRILAGLDSLDVDVLQAGVGGPGLRAPEEGSLWSVDSTVSKAAFAVEYDLSALERRARLLSESLSEATDSLEAHHDLLESTPSIIPTAGLLSSRFTRSRYHPIHHRNLPHEGIDLAAERGTPIMAAAQGRVAFAGRRSGYGLMVEIDHGYGYVTRYGHASNLLVRRGQTVERGDVIAQVGSTGIATSSHLHYEVLVSGRPVNPLNFVISGAIP